MSSVIRDPRGNRPAATIWNLAVGEGLFVMIAS